MGLASSVSAYGDLSEPDIREALASRERYEVEAALRRHVPAGLEGVAAGASDEDLRNRISDRAYKLIIDLETGGRAYYESPRGINKRPVWPAGQSGVTVGCG